MDRVELIWSAAYVIHPTNPVDDPVFDDAEAACTVVNEERDVVFNEVELMAASRTWLADGMDVESNRIEFTSFTYSSMPYVDATALDDAHGND